MRRIGVLMPLVADDPEAQTRLAAFAQGLERLGWTIGRNIRIETRWTAGDADRIRTGVAELLALEPDAILATGSTTVGPLRRATRAVPIVFVVVPDPVGAGFVANLARPGGNVTGFIAFEYGISPKWLEILKQLAPGVTRVAVIRDPDISGGIGQFGAIQAVAASFGVETIPLGVRDAGEIEHDIAAFAQGSNGGLIVTEARGRWFIVS
jgi:putative ABC transport system substrate-binding protein